MSVFIDSGVFVAFHNTRDPNNCRGVRAHEGGLYWRIWLCIYL